MADKYLNYTGLNYYHNRIKTQFADATDFSDLQDDVSDLQTTVEGLVTEGGEPNLIDTVKVNNVALVPDANKAVNIAVPTALSELTNDGDGTQGSAYATEDYVDTNGGKIDTISVNNVQQTITNKNVNIDLTSYALTADVPTATSDLTNDSDFQTEQEVQTLIDDALADVTGIDFEVVQALPQSGQKGVIYLVQKTGTSGDVYDEYIWVTPQGSAAHFEKIGTTEVDLSDYWAISDLVAITTAEIDTITG